MCTCRIIEKNCKLYFHSLGCSAGAEVSRYTDDQDVVGLHSLQTNRKYKLRNLRQAAARGGGGGGEERM